MEQNQQSDTHDTQAVIAAMHLLMRCLHSSEQKMVLSSLMRENEYLHMEGDLKYYIDAATEIAQPKYPIEPLVLDSEESNKSAEEHMSSTGYATGEGETPYEASSEGGYREKVLTTYASFLLPLTASFMRRRWWGYLIVSSIFLLTLSLTSLFSYKAGIQAEVVSRPVVVALPVTCMLPVVIPGPPAEAIFRQSGQGNAVFWYRETVKPINGASYVLNPSYRENFACPPFAMRVLIHP